MPSPLYDTVMKYIMTILLLSVALGIVFIWYIDKKPRIEMPSYESALAATSSERIKLMEAESESEKEAIERFKLLWSKFTPENISNNLSRVYAREVWFNDTIRTVTNLASLEHYMVETAGRVASCKIEFMNFFHSDGDYFSRWKMSIYPDIKSPDTMWKSYGISHLRFDEAGLVVLHQDYWDPAGGIYENLPIIGWILRNIRVRL